MFENHRWSGWPGAYCHYCGQPDPHEEGLADNIPRQMTTCPATKEEKMAVDRVMNPEKE